MARRRPAGGSVSLSDKGFEDHQRASGRPEAGTCELVIGGVCLKCGLCVQLCPVSAIKVKNRAFVIGGGCLDCRACLEACPVGAILPKGPEIQE